MLYFSSSYCIMAVKVAPIKSLSKWYVLPSFCLRLCVRVFYACSFACDYIKTGLWAGELLKIELLLLLLLLLIFNGIIITITI
jgi:hypothetical protein